MIKKRFIVILLVMMLPILPSATLTEASVDSDQSTDQLTIGTTSGVAWAYNEHKERTFTSSVNLDDEITVAKTVHNDRTFERTIQLMTGTSVIDSFYERLVQFTRRDGTGSPYKQEKGLGLKGTIGNQTGNFNNIFSPGLNAFYRYDWLRLSPSSGNAFAQSLIGLAGPLGFGWKTTNVTLEVVQIHEIPLLDFFQKEYGTIFVPEVKFTFLNDVSNTPGNLADDEVILIEKINRPFNLGQIIVRIGNYPQFHFVLFFFIEYFGLFDDFVFHEYGSVGAHRQGNAIRRTCIDNSGLSRSSF